MPQGGARGQNLEHLRIFLVVFLFILWIHLYLNNSFLGLMLLLHNCESSANLNNDLFAYKSQRNLANFMQIFRPATYKAYV